MVTSSGKIDGLEKELLGLDAREVKAWLQQQEVQPEDCMFPVVPDSREPRIPMTDLQWAKAKRLSLVLQYASIEYKRDKEFVRCFTFLDYDYPLTHRQSRLINRLWDKYHRLHGNMYGATKWIEDYATQYRMATGSVYELSEIGRFDNDVPIKPYDCNPANDVFTIVFHEPDESFF
jgi:hypothetical protein